ncbi:MAG: hypothetical protein HY282_07435 [Nitrospirae bacterium]|nr:hypothetical protein [Candidatus Manganitrophaceae bacterium]
MHQEEPIDIYFGWDRPLQGFFMFIENPECKDEEERFLYSNLNEEESHPKSIQGFLDVLESFQISLPAAMIDEVLRDGRENYGNKFVEHQIINGQYQRVQKV